MHKTIKVRLFPTKAQETKLKTLLDRCRRARKYFLKTCIDALKKGQTVPSSFDLIKLVPAMRQRVEYQNINSQVLQAVARVVADEIKSCLYRKVDIFDLLEPSHDVTTILFPQYPKGARIREGVLCTDRVGNIRMSDDPDDENIKRVALYCTRLGKWYASFITSVPDVEKGVPKAAAIRSAVGLDFGVRYFVTLSTGKTYTYPQKLIDLGKDMKKSAFKGASRKLEHKKEKYKNLRDNFFKQTISDILKNHDAIFVEDIDKEAIVRNFPFISKSCRRLPWRMFIDSLEQKCNQEGIVFGRVDQVNTTRRCSKCLVIGEKLHIRQRTFTCSQCGFSMDRDQNAAMNVMLTGLSGRKASLRGEG